MYITYIREDVTDELPSDERDDVDDQSAYGEWLVVSMIMYMLMCTMLQCR